MFYIESYIILYLEILSVLVVSKSTAFLGLCHGSGKHALNILSGLAFPTQPTLLLLGHKSLLNQRKHFPQRSILNILIPYLSQEMMQLSEQLQQLIILLLAKPRQCNSHIFIILEIALFSVDDDGVIAVSAQSP